MNTREIGVTIAFSALTIALNLIRIPVPYLLSFSYQLGDISIIVAFLLFGPKRGITVALLSMVANMTIFPVPGGLVGPPYYFLAILSMFLGIYISERNIGRKLSTSETHPVARRVTLSTILGASTRTLIMLPLDYTVYGLLVALVVPGITLSAAYAIVFATMPLIVSYNISVPLFMIPISYFIARKVSTIMKIQKI